MSGRVKFKGFSRAFKVMNQEVQGLKAEKKVLEISKQ
jgi:hypothetical protein